MHSSRIGASHWALLLVVALVPVPRAAWAQTSAPLHAESKVRLRVVVPDTDPFISVLDQSEQVVAECYRSCNFWLVRDDYVVSVSDGDTARHSYALELRRSTTLTLTPAKKGIAYLGMTVGIAGTLVSLAGFTWFLMVNLDADLRAREDGRAKHVAQDELVGSLLVMVGGAAMVTGGWMLFGRNRRPSFEERALATATVSPTLRLGAAPLVGGAAVAATLTF